jgi:hypothetical protein
MKTTSQGEVPPDSIIDPVIDPQQHGWDWPSALMIALAVAVSLWCFWPDRNDQKSVAAQVAAGQRAPGLWCVDAATSEPLLGLLPRGWFVWLVLAPADSAEKSRLENELQLIQKTWAGMADLDRWRAVLVVAQKEQALATGDQVRAQGFVTPWDIGLATRQTWETWGHASRVRHVLIEPTGRILLIEPADAEQPGTVKKISDEIRRRLQQWEGNFDDQPRFS